MTACAARRSAWATRKAVRAAASAGAEGRSAHLEGVELVAVWIAEIAGIEAGPAFAGRALVASAERERDFVHGVDLRGVFAFERDHGAVADAGGRAVERPRDVERCAAGPAPDDRALVRPYLLCAERFADRVVETPRAGEVVGSERHVADEMGAPAALAHHMHVELVAVAIAKIAGVEPRRAWARARRAFVLCPERDRERVDRIDLGRACAGDRG